MVRCGSQQEGDAIVQKLYKLLLKVDGEPCTVLRTANTVTFARSWPERHVQVVLYTMPSVGHILAFADLDCALDGLEIAAQSFSRSILGGELRNLSPPCVLIRYKAKWGREGGFRRKHANSDFNANLGLHRHGSHRWSSVHDHSLSPRADTQDQLGTSVGNIKRGGVRTTHACLVEHWGPPRPQPPGQPSGSSQVPVSMLAVRRDTPKRVANYVKRGLI